MVGRRKLARRQKPTSEPAYQRTVFNRLSHSRERVRPGILKGPPNQLCGVVEGGSGGETASLRPCGVKGLKSDWFTVAISACASIAVAAMRQSNWESQPRGALPKRLAGYPAAASTLLHPDLLAGCEELTQRRRDSLRNAEKGERKCSSPPRSSAPSASLR